MDIRQLRYFIGIAESASLTEAARKLHIVQPALSQRLADLEEELGVQLVVRGRVGTALTPAGTELHERARLIIKQTEYAAAAVKEKAGLAEGVLTIGLLRSVAPIVSARLFTELKAQMPNVVPQIRAGYSAELNTLLRTGALDIATLVRPQPAARGEASVFSERLHLVAPAAMLKKLPALLRLPHIARLPLLLSPMQPAHRLLMEAAAKAQLQLQVVGGIEDNASVLELCGQGLAATVLSASSAQRATEGRALASRPLDEPGLMRHVAIASPPEAPKTGAILLCELILGRLLAEALGGARTGRSSAATARRAGDR